MSKMTMQLGKKLREGATFMYRVVVTENNVAGGSVTIKIAPPVGSEFEIICYHLGPDDYAAGRTVRARLFDEDDVALTMWDNDDMDNQDMFGPRAAVSNSTIIATTPSSIGLPPWGTLVSSPDYLVFSVFSLVQNETFTASVRLRIIGHTPTITITSTGTPAPVETYNRVIG